MVDLPTTPLNVPEVRAPQSRVSAQQIAAPSEALANSLEKAADVLSKDVAVPLAKKAGLQAVTIDANGEVQVERVPMVGDAAVAYGDAIKTGAVLEAENRARLDNVERRQKFIDDPAGYLKATEAYAKAQVPKFKVAGTEAQFLIRKTINQLGAETYKGLVNQKETRDLNRVATATTTEIKTLENEVMALANAGDVSSPEFQGRIAKIEALYGTLVNNPRLAFPKEQANAAMANLGSELEARSTEHYLSREVYDREGPGGALRAAEKIKTDPNLRLTPGQRESYYNRAVGAIQARARAFTQGTQTAAAEIDTLAKLAADGRMPTPQQLAEVQQIAAQSGAPAVVQRYETAVRNLSTLAAWRQMSPAQVEMQMQTLDRIIASEGLNEDRNFLRQNGQKLLDTMRKEIADNPLGWANRVNTVTILPLDFNSPFAAQDMRARVVAAEIVAQQYGRSPVYLMPDEKRALEVSTQQGGPAMLKTARDLAQGFGDRAGRVLGEVSNEAPILAHMGGLLSGGLFGGGSQTFANDVAEAVQLRQDKEFKLPRWAEHKSDKIITAQHTRTIANYGDAFYLVPDNGRAAEASAQAAYFARANRRGYDALVESSDSKKAYDRALQEGAGATFDARGTQWGGVTSIRPGYWQAYKVLVPSTIRADRFGDVIGAITDTDLSRLPVTPQDTSGKTYPARTLHAAVPVAGPGGYRFALGDPASEDPKWMRGADGRPFVLNLDSLEPVLRSRVPGAYQGGGR